MARSLRSLGQVARLGFQEASNAALAVSGGASPAVVAAAAAERGLVGCTGSALRMFGRQNRGMAGSSGHHPESSHAESTPTGLHPHYKPEMNRILPEPPMPKPYSPGVFSKDVPVDRSVMWIEKDPIVESWVWRRVHIENEFRWDFRTTFELAYIWFFSWYLFYIYGKFIMRHGDKRSDMPRAMLFPEPGWITDEGYILPDEREFYGACRPLSEKMVPNPV